MSVRENFLRIQESLSKIDSAGPIQVLGVAKFQPLERLREAWEAGVNIFGNNYVQEGKAARAEIPEGQWHFIGQIQSRKAKDLLTYDLVQSLDRLDIAAEWNKRLLETKQTLNVLVEINLGMEASKAGIALEQFPEFRKSLEAFSQLRVRGLMGMPPPLDPPEARRPYFQKLRRLFETSQSDSWWDILSMGTSEDYLIAAQEGASLIRLGTVLFGPRVR